MKIAKIKTLFVVLLFPITCLAIDVDLKAMSDSIFERGVQLYNQKDYNAAILEFQKCDALDEQYMDPVLNRREYARIWMSRCYYLLGDEEQAKKLSYYYKVEPINRKLTETSDSLAFVGHQYGLKSDYQHALQYGLACLNLEKEIIGEDNYIVANSYYFIAECYTGIEDYQNAIVYHKKSISLKKNVLGDQSIECLSSLSELSSLYSMTNEPDSTIKYAKETLDLYLKTNGTKDSIYCDFLKTLYLSYCIKGDNQKALHSGEELVKLIEQYDGKYSEEYAYYMNSLASHYLDIDNARVLNIREELAPIIKDIYGAGSEQYLFNLDVLSGLNYENNNYSECLRFGQEFLSSEKIDSYNPRSLIRIAADVALSYVTLNDYHGAIDPLLKVNELLNDTSALYLGLLSNCYALDDNYQQALMWSEKYIKALQNNPTTEKDDINNAIDTQSFILENLGNYSYALENRLLLLEHQIPTSIENAIDKAYSLKNLAWLYYHLGYAKKAVQYGEEAIDLLNNCSPTQRDLLYPKIFDNLAIYYCECGDFNKAISNEMEALNLYIKLYGPNNHVVATSYDNLSTIYQSMGNYDVALEYCKKAFEIQDIQVEKDTSSYVISLNNYAFLLYLKGNYKLAKESFEKALCVWQDSYGQNEAYYSQIISNYAQLLTDMGDFEPAILYHKKTLYIKKQTLGILSKGYGESMNDMSKYYNAIGDYQNALVYSDSALCILKQVVGELHPSYASALSNLALVQANIGDYKEAITNAEIVCEIKKHLYGVDGYYYIKSLGNLAVYYSNIGYDNYAIKLQELVAETEKNVLGDTHPHYLVTLNNLAIEYSNSGNKIKSIELLEKVLKTQQSCLGKNHPDCANTLYNLAAEYMKINEYDKAIQYIDGSLTIYEETYGNCHPDVASCLSFLASLYLVVNDYQQALKYDQKSLEIRKTIFGENNISYYMSLSDVARDYFFLNDYASAWQYEKLYCYNLKRYYCDNLYEFDTNSRESFWNRYAFKIDSDLPFFCLYTPKQEQDLAFLYDYSALFSKGLLLNIESNIRDYMLESEDSITVCKYDEIRRNKNIINRLYELPMNERFADLDSLEQETRKLEKDLLRLTAIGRDYSQNLNTKWKDVQQNLNQNDVAIEFLSFKTRNDSIMYIALTLDDNDSQPKMFALFEKKEIESISVNNYYRSDSLYNLIWKPIEKELEGKDNIYFSPAGLLHNIGIEYLPFNDTINIADKYNLIRLSSTRELVNKNQARRPAKAALYGGLLYNIDPEVIQEDNLANNYKSKFGMMMRGLKDSLNTRADFGPLRYTLKEVEEIDNLLTNKNLRTILFTEYNGTEESFKSLDGQDVNILHLATHGSYIPNVNAVKKKEESNYRFIRVNDNNAEQIIEDQSLTRSFLVMSGGNMLVHGDSIPADIDDGILTAQEISRLDLRGLDLVVLSACETALGDITSEGVMGLQRGFKKAGAQTIVMSLWKVADEPTQQFMSEFYRLLVEGENKRQSFKGAQKLLRDKYPEQSDKPYWSAFIMLD